MERNLRSRLLPRLERLYGPRAEECLAPILVRTAAAAARLARRAGPLWDEKDVVLITYGDQVRSPDEPPLAALRRFLFEQGLHGLVNTVHLLPFFPYSSDDGFSVIDYRQVDPVLGDWDDVARLGEDYALMFDLVLNHVSRRSRYFEEYWAGREPFVRFFHEVDPATDLSAVTRPRSLPLLTPVETPRGTRHLWTTFSDDQIDLNFAEPAVLSEMVDVLLFYLERGARIIRLDAIAYLWKRIGTPCIHLPETHEVVKLLRDLLDAVAPWAILLTETNVPHRENVSYFGQGDEARMVYQFSLAPLLLEALLAGDASLLAGWLSGLEPPPPGCAVLNFTASHDGIGVRPLEGIMPAARFARLIEAVRARGGRIGMKRNPDGTESPYELNVTYFSALADADPRVHLRRFLAGQAVMLALQGIPAVYFHSLVATENDTAAVERTGQPRSINRRKFTAAELADRLRGNDAIPGAALAAYRRLLAVRTAQPAFHPEAPQQVIPQEHPSLLGFVRASIDRGQQIFVTANLGREPQPLALPAEFRDHPLVDLLAEPGDEGIREGIALEPFQVAWLARSTLR